MLFNSWSFVAFLLFVLVVMMFTRTWGIRFRNTFLLACSYMFYGMFSFGFLLILGYITVLNYMMGKRMIRSQRPQMICSVTVILSIVPLIVFKYTSFIISLIDDVVKVGIPNFAESWVLPVGISFFTFQALSYTIDICRKKISVENNILDFALFVAFFPTILSGPIEKARNLLPQIKEGRGITASDVVIGARIFVWGVFKKMVIADRLAQYVDYVYAGAEYASSLTLILAAVLYSIQIYCDFSGYSDMALGVGRSLGFHLTQNFSFPYFSSSIKSFWKKWHISLTSWFTEYVYISLGGNRVSTIRWVINISLVFLLSGIWHGAAVGFIIWGAVHALLYLLEHMSGWGTCSKNASCIASIIGGICTFLFITAAWVFFRLPSFGDAISVFSSMLNKWDGTLNTGPSAFSFAINCACLVFFITSEVLLKFGYMGLYNNEGTLLRRVTTSIWLLGVVILIELFCVTSNQFVYFQF